ncbi:hypothetical protein [Spirosoma litoris]
MNTELTANTDRFQDKFDRILRHWKDRTGRVVLPLDLEQQLDRWVDFRMHMLEFPYESDPEYVKVIMVKFDCSQRTAYQLLNDTRRFFASAEAVNQEFEKVMLLADLKKQIKRLDDKESRNEKELLAAKRLLAKLIGADQPANAEGGGNTVINILNYNPELLGAKPVANLQELIDKIKSDDTLRLQADLLDDEQFTP